MRNGWTGGQYSLFRFLFGTYLVFHFAHLLPWSAELFSNQGVLPEVTASPLIKNFPYFPNVLAHWDHPTVVNGLLFTAVGLGILFAIGCYDRLAALGMWYIGACLFGRNPLIANPSLPYVGWMLLAHACLPPAPYGSWAARGRADPAGAWRFTPLLFAGIWLLMALGYTYSGYTKLISPSWQDGTALARVLDNPLARPGWIREALLSLPAELLRIGTWGALGLELFFAPLALIRVIRPWLWAAMLGMHLSLLVLIDFADLSLGMVMLHFFTFDPAWIKPAKGPTERMFYDGQCGLCHRAVRFVLAEDRTGAAFRFAPLDGEAFRAAAPESAAAWRNPSVVVLTAQGRMLMRSAAVIQVGRRLGGIWRLLAGAVSFLPRPLRDRLYDLVARNRYRLFAKPRSDCPVLPPELRDRFDL
jgi:predicted DCC family thiol-disulfide oxidoreductase YuxK